MSRTMLASLGVVTLVTASVAITAAEAGPRPAATYTIIIDKMAFGAPPRGLHVGDTIVWVNRDTFQHSATATDHSFDVDLPPGKSGRMRLSRAGSVRFSCKYHPGMKGALAVAR
jgi:plastocyanin